MAVVLLAGCSVVEGISPTNSPDAAIDRAGTVNVGDGRDLYLECHGNGSPTVVLVSGLGDSAEVWNTRLDEAGPDTPTVYEDVARFTRVCAYDRPGTGGSRSTEVDQPTTAQISADDVQKLLAASGEKGPFVLAGHSYGGPIIRLFASEHPDDVAGLVLVDALSEDLQAGLTAEQQAVFEQINAPTQPGAESFDFATLVTEMQDSAPVRDIPVIVLTADTPQLTPELVASGQLPAAVDQEFADALWAAQLSAQDLLPAKFTDAVHVTDTRSNHYVQLGNPQLVIDSIHDVVLAVRD
ncbi:alpha/beta fold hydrolase [Microbacterium sp. cf046]|uniref:alpha/beta fold hydrolase n=1 Tax=Microbacterium sp. cf046 TaxID=1761803 RepID=UPI001C318355|nr:alpha/beta hydrolase [Microbacterium sp. cf046]